MQTGCVIWINGCTERVCPRLTLYISDAADFSTVEVAAARAVQRAWREREQRVREWAEWQGTGMRARELASMNV